MTGFDYGVIAICLLSMLLGLWRGIIGEIIALVAWVAAFLAARAFGQETGEILFATQITDATMRLLAGWGVVILGVLILLALVRWFIQKLMRSLGLSFFDHFAGLCFGLVRGLLIVLLLVALGGLTTLPQQAWWREAQLAPPLEIAVQALSAFLPYDLAQQIQFK